MGTPGHCPGFCPRCGQLSVPLSRAACSFVGISRRTPHGAAPRAVTQLQPLLRIKPRAAARHPRGSKNGHGIRHLTEQPELFEAAKVDVGGYGIVWNDDLDLSCDELLANGKEVKTPFDGLIAFSDATEIWGLNESTLRKAIAYGKLINGVDVCKYGKKWVISSDAMRREYGDPDD